jgi:hypothetical protein
LNPDVFIYGKDSGSHLKLVESRQGTPTHRKTRLEAGVAGLGAGPGTQRRTRRNQSKFHLFCQVRSCLVPHKYQSEIHPEAEHHTKHNYDNLGNTKMSNSNSRGL